MADNQGAIDKTDSLDDVIGWVAKDLDNTDTWLVNINSSDYAEVLHAVRLAKSTGKNLLNMRVHDFPLPNFARRLHAVRSGLERNPGFCVLRGLPVVDCDESDARLIAWGIGLHLGVALAQDEQDTLILDVRDAGLGQTVQLRGNHTAQAISFHVDPCDVVALICRRVAKSGGLSNLCSSEAIVRQLSITHPNLLDILSRPIPYAAVGGSHKSYYRIPVFGTCGGWFTSHFYKARVLKVINGVCPPDEADAIVNALECVEQLAAAPQFRFDFCFQPGDLQLVNNHVVYHARTAFTDHPDPDLRRHLFRIWLAVPDSRPLPASFREFWGSAEAGTLRGGIGAPLQGAEPLVRFQREMAKYHKLNGSNNYA